MSWPQTMGHNIINKINIYIKCVKKYPSYCILTTVYHIKMKNCNTILTQKRFIVQSKRWEKWQYHSSCYIFLMAYRNKKSCLSKKIHSSNNWISNATKAHFKIVFKVILIWRSKALRRVLLTISYSVNNHSIVCESFNLSRVCEIICGYKFSTNNFRQHLSRVNF